MKKWLMLVLTVSLFMMLVACSDDDTSGDNTSDGGNDSETTETENDEGEAASGEAIELNFWVYGSAGYDVLVDEYMDENPNVTININEGEMEDVHNNLFTSISAGSGAPDISMIEISNVAKFMEANDQFYNLNDYGAADIKDKYLDWKWQQAESVDGSFQLGLPTDIGPTTMFYRTDVMEEAGLPTDPVELAGEIDTWDSYREAAEKIYDETGKPITDSPELMFYAIRDQQEQQYFNEDDELIVEDTVKEAYDFTTQMIEDGYVGQNSLWTPEWGSAMEEGSYATLIGAPAWMIANVKGNAPDSGGDWSLTTIPEGAGNWGGSFLTIPAESEHPQEAYDFIEWLVSPENQLKSFHNNGLFPSAPEVYEDEEFLATTDEYFSGAETARIFAEAAETVQPVYMGVNYSIVNDEIVTALTNVAVEGADPQEEWDAAISRIESQLERQ
ncbi:cellobiose transport system substrate-binding protein [Gracilibacillus orientalis]|uniref:Cellobiose transport system substrate-binding protein n=1 Tax=Gracilibacillus orientalis TaxID=334253 RepID=A0A1I4PAH4_9BACI|nr:extracellular solute-binding protein [Gracilibacillus orientalis]SFM24620.1 cellobiose transport system substrate-binding protein [Gracilibacillus orientalis]